MTMTKVDSQWKYEEWIWQADIKLATLGAAKNFIEEIWSRLTSWRKKVFASGLLTGWQLCVQYASGWKRGWLARLWAGSGILGRGHSLGWVGLVTLLVGGSRFRSRGSVEQVSCNLVERETGHGNIPAGILYHWYITTGMLYQLQSSSLLSLNGLAWH